MPAFKDLTGQRYGKLVVLCVQMRAVHNRKPIKWLCQCDCGKTSAVAASHLKNGDTKSCGCFRKEAPKKHGGHRSGTYSSWMAMKNRCRHESNQAFKDYGGRGIKVCERWLGSYDNFLVDMGPRPLAHSIERVDVDGDYEPGNCKWIPLTEQWKNKRRPGGRQRLECNQIKGTTTSTP